MKEAVRWLNLNLRTLKRASATPPVHENAQVILDEELAPHLLLGLRGERLAAEFLERTGYRLVASNFKLPVGRNLRGALVHAEIDLVAYEGDTLCFIEVKTRASDWFTAPEANVDLRKQRQITRAARVYSRLFNLTHEPHRYDVISIILSPSDERRETVTKIELLRNFWTDDKFRKRRWRQNPLAYDQTSGPKQSPWHRSYLT